MDFSLIKSFDIDSGELDEYSKQESFVLGYELGEIDNKLKLNIPLACLCHAANRERIEKSCRDANREFTITWMDGDSSETWMWLTVK